MFSKKMLSLKIFVLLCTGHSSATHSDWLYMNKNIKKQAELPMDYMREYYEGEDLTKVINNDITSYDEINALWEEDSLIRYFCGNCLYYDEDDDFYVIRLRSTKQVVAVIRFSCDRYNRTSTIRQIAVKKNHRYRGLASYLMQAAERLITLRDCQSIVLCVHSYNKSALSIYKKIGFKARK